MTTPENHSDDANPEVLMKPSGEFETWEEFEESMDKLLENHRNKQRKRAPFPVTKGTENYLYELDELSEIGFYIRVRRGKEKSSEPDLWPLIDTTPFIGGRLNSVSELVLRFTKADQGAGLPARMDLVTNPSLEEFNLDRRIDPRSAPRRRHLRPLEMRSLIMEANAVGPIPIRPSEGSKMNFASNFRLLAQNILN